jgi:hypothetical protein
MTAVKILGGIILALIVLLAGGCIMILLTSRFDMRNSGYFSLLGLATLVFALAAVGLVKLFNVYSSAARTPMPRPVDEAGAEERHQKIMAQHIKDLEREAARKKNSDQ